MIIDYMLNFLLKLNIFYYNLKYDEIGTINKTLIVFLCIYKSILIFKISFIKREKYKYKYRFKWKALKYDYDVVVFYKK